MHNITLPGEQQLADTVRSLHEQYATRAETFWGMQDMAARRSMYFSEMLPLFTRIKDTAQEVIRINEENMVQADLAARSLSARSTRYMAFAVLLGIVGAAYFAGAAEALDSAAHSNSHVGLQGTRRGQIGPGRAGGRAGRTGTARGRI